MGARLGCSRPIFAIFSSTSSISCSSFSGVGWFYREWLKGNKKIFSTWKDCDWRSKEFFEGLKKQMTDRTFKQEFECEFLEMESAALPAELIEKAVTNEFEAWN